MHPDWTQLLECSLVKSTLFQLAYLFLLRQLSLQENNHFHFNITLSLMFFYITSSILKEFESIAQRFNLTGAQSILVLGLCQVKVLRAC